MIVSDTESLADGLANRMLKDGAIYVKIAIIILAYDFHTKN